MTSGSRFVFPYQTAIDENGVPIPGALLYFYESMTSTPLNTFADAALSTPNSNPVVANSSGTFPSIFMEPLPYKVILTDPLQNQIWEADPVTSLDSLPAIGNSTVLGYMGPLGNGTAQPILVSAGSNIQLAESPGALTISAIDVAGARKNLKFNVSSNTTVAFTFDALMLFNNAGNFFVASENSGNITTGANGANALDTGSVTEATWYSLWAIYNPVSKNVAGLLSLSATAPTLPAGYTYKARFGWVRTQVSSTHLIVSEGFGVDGRSQYQTTPLPTIVSGAVGNVSVPTWVQESVTTFVPPTACAIVLVTTVYSGDLIVAPNNTYGGIGNITNPPPICQNTSELFSVANVSVFDSRVTELNLEGGNISVAAAIGGNTTLVQCLGWVDNL